MSVNLDFINVMEVIRYFIMSQEKNDSLLSKKIENTYEKMSWKSYVIIFQDREDVIRKKMSTLTFRYLCFNKFKLHLTYSNQI